MNTLEQKGNHIDHSKANVYLQLNNASGEYFSNNPNPDPDLPERWKIKDSRYLNKTNFKGVLYTNGEEYAFVFLGTDVKSPKDWAANAQMSLGSPNTQCKQAVEFCEDMLSAYNIDPSKVTAVGNSEGAREVIEVLQQTPIKNGVTFNGYMRVDKADYPPENFKNLVNYRTEKDIIERLGGGDQTDGSCSSLAFAYCGNKAGYDVLDFRDGNSREFFGENKYILRIAELPNVNAKIEWGKDDEACTIRLMDQMEPGKEYYLATGVHAAIVRLNNGRYEYLELQQPKELNGWYPLHSMSLIERFGCDVNPKELPHFLIEVESLSNCTEFLDLLGFINTAESEQNKGDAGYAK